MALPLRFGPRYKLLRAVVCAKAARGCAAVAMKRLVEDKAHTSPVSVEQTDGDRPVKPRTANAASGLYALRS